MLISQPILSTGWVCRSNPYLASSSSFCWARWYREATLCSSLEWIGTLFKPLPSKMTIFVAYYVRHVPVFSLCSVHREARLFFYLQSVSSHFPPSSRCRAPPTMRMRTRESSSLLFLVELKITHNIYVYVRVSFSKKIQNRLTNY